MSKNPTVIELIKAWLDRQGDSEITTDARDMVLGQLEDNDFDGLFTDDCGCVLDDLFPCSGRYIPTHCRAGYRNPCPTEDGWDCEAGEECQCVGADKPKAKGDEDET